MGVTDGRQIQSHAARPWGSQDEHRERKLNGGGLVPEIADTRPRYGRVDGQMFFLSLGFRTDLISAVLALFLPLRPVSKERLNLTASMRPQAYKLLVTTAT